MAEDDFENNFQERESVGSYLRAPPASVERWRRRGPVNDDDNKNESGAPFESYAPPINPNGPRQDGVAATTRWRAPAMQIKRRRRQQQQQRCALEGSSAAAISFRVSFFFRSLSLSLSGVGRRRVEQRARKNWRRTAKKKNKSRFRRRDSVRALGRRGCGSDVLALRPLPVDWRAPALSGAAAA